MKKIYFLMIFLWACTTLGNKALSQSVLDPKDSVVEYDALNPPTQPPYGTIGKWARTRSVSWNTSSYKCYIYKGSCFRLKFPASYNPLANDGKKYPIAIVFHGGGEAGPITDNETQLYHGGTNYRDAVDSGKFDGYVMFMQSQGFWGITSYTRIIEILNYMINNNKLDPFQVSVNGLSSGGQASWEMLLNYPTYISASLPMSNVSIGYKDPSVVNEVRFTPMWNFQGALDGSPSPSTARQVQDAMVNAGGNYRYSEYVNVGHSTWDSAFADPDFFPFMVRGYSSNPWTLYGRTEFCVGDVIDLTIGLAPGFDGYQWRKDGVAITGATGNSLHVTAVGIYDARVLRGVLWSDWSHIPATIQITPPTVTPPITVSGLMSSVLESADGRNYVNLEVPGNGFTSYTWKRVGKDSIIGNTKIYTATETGDYIAAVTEPFGCSSVYTQPFTVVDAKGNKAPDAASKLTALTVSSTEILLSWENNPHPSFNEQYFEIYRSTVDNSGYSFVARVPADTLRFKDAQLSPGVKYFYKIRAVNGNGAAPISNIASAIAAADAIPPTAPGNLQLVYTTANSAKIQWDSASDNVGVVNYEVFVNGVKSYVTNADFFVLNALEYGKTYTIYVKATDAAGNRSVQSNMVGATTSMQGLLYKYYEGYWTSLPDFNTLTPIETGVTKGLDLSVRNRPTQFAMLWQGYLNVPVADRYKFALSSEDGSKFWMNTYDPSATPVINNDRLNSKKAKFAWKKLDKTVYPISIGYYQNKNAKSIQLSWESEKFFGDTLLHPIDPSFFSDGYPAADTAPAPPSNLSVTPEAYNRITVAWTDNSSNESGFQVYRSLYQSTGYIIIFTTSENINSFTDTGLQQKTKYYYKLNAVNNYGISAFVHNTFAVTPVFPFSPKPAGNVNASAISSSSINISWTDVNENETGYQVFRSALDSFNFKLAAILPANTTSYVDSGLYGNVNYYYKVRAVNNNVLSLEKPAVSAITKSNPPAITNKFSTQVVPFGTLTIIQITATDPDGDSIYFTTANLPSFTTFTDNHNGTAAIAFNPSASQQGVYSNIKIIAAAISGESDSEVFTLTVNNNYSPVIDSVPDYSLNEGDTLVIPLSATDLNGTDTLSWSAAGLANSYTLLPIANGRMNIILTPGFAASGTYQVIATVSDGHGGIGTRQFTIYIKNKEPGEIIYARFKDQDVIGSPWNNISGVTITGLVTASGKTTPTAISLQTSWFATANQGPQTGNNSGIYPDPVLKDYYYFGRSGGPATVNGIISGLNNASLYNISFYGASNWSGAADNGNTIYSIGTQSISLPVQNNTSNTANFINMRPASDGTINFMMSKAANAQAGYINAIVIRSIYTDTSKPLAPDFLAATIVAGKAVQLTWNDVSFNETNYVVYRAINHDGPFVLLNNGLSSNSTSYLDTTATGSTQYFYMVKAVTSTNSSDASEIVGIITPDKVPVIIPIASITIKNNQQQNILITASDDSADHIQLTAANLPSFVSFTDNGNGTGTFVIAPTSGITGTFENVSVTATDNSDSSASTSFNITVTDQNLTSVYINFSNGITAAAPWNNLTQWPAPNTTLSNIYDDNNNLSTITMKLLNGFQGYFVGGMQPGYDKGIYPDNVMRAGEYEGSIKTDSILFSGLQPSLKYNFVFFNSHDDGQQGNTIFNINGQTLTLNATHNINKTVSINGIVPNANGQVFIAVSKGAGAAFAYINSLIIQSYNNTLSLLAPTELRSVNLTRTTASLQWADRSLDETGFEIWRASDTTGSGYTLLNSLPANSTTFTDSNLVSGKTYFYTVRAVNQNSQSAFCNPVAVTTYLQAIYVNFSNSSNANVPWNNTIALPDQGLMWNNLFDDFGLPSSVSLQELGLFAGLYNAGVSTGNNSGIYPDKVILESYGLFAGQQTSLKITGLNLGRQYDLTFFASSQAGGDVNTSYSVNGRKVILNASLNTNGTVTLYNVLPDKNGEAIITIAPNTSTSQYGLIGALVIQEYQPYLNTIPSPQQFKKAQAIATTHSLKATNIAASEAKLYVYPNPFSNYFDLNLSMSNSDRVIVEIYDLNGRVILSRNLGNLLAGTHNFRILPEARMAAGLYLLDAKYLHQNFVQSRKILKE